VVVAALEIAVAPENDPVGLVGHRPRRSAG
jgi:hypothetical protein